MKSNSKPGRQAALRKRAEDFLNQSRSSVTEVPFGDARDLVEEQHIYQAELEMQNEELGRAYLEIEEARDRYSNLYDFAPMGYFTVSEKGMIRDTNLYGAGMLRMDRDKLVGMRFSHFIEPDDQDAFYFYRKKCYETKTKQTCELRLTKGDKSKFHAQLDSVINSRSRRDLNEMRIAVTDISERKQFEEKLQQSKDALERRVLERTAALEARTRELEILNKELDAEIVRRRKSERDLKRSSKNIIEEHRRRKYLSNKLVQMLEMERRDIAMALHDQIGQTLTSLIMEIDLAQGHSGREWQRNLESLKNKLSDAMGFIRNISHTLRPHILDNLGLVPAVKALVETMEKKSALDIVFFSRGIPDAMNPDKELAVYRILQESLTNVLKHARAKNVFCNLVKRGRTIILTVEDDGKGFDVHKTAELTETGGSLGIMIMRERAIQAGGELRIETAEGKGTNIVAEIPIQSDNSEQESVGNA